ncbi:MAG: peptide-methionine (S)-S-oxide reductase MsrA [Flavobacteriales bacterium]|jgi:peptide-methionine (S)-S-oxide reductase|nr:peptide-methionine (S)-S-oxide reductase MsrA [Flavobacteriaceae bacterium]|tara:strand:- start:1006 stop:1659 length:654 start_codon:yes stop_codon:yes gene_type:complete
MKINKNIILISMLVFLAISFSFKETLTDNNIANINKISSTDKVAYFASGCFWCVEAIFESVEGVSEAVSGYAGGHTKNPTYQTIGTGRTGHAEAVAVYYNPEVVSFKILVDVFFGSHDPTTKNGQHPDYGSQYRSIAFYNTMDEKELINLAIEKLNKETYNNKIVTEVYKHTVFYKAEDYHQDYERLNPYNSYVRNVSVPRLKRFQKKFPKLLKVSH